MIRPWTGVRRIAFIPVWNRRVDSPPPTDWIDQVRARVFYDPNPTSQIDRSFRRYLQTASSGMADFEGAVFPVVAADDDDTVGAGLNSLPSSHGYDSAVIILPHSAGPHRGGFAWFPGPTTNGVSYFCRVAMFSDATFSDPKTLGVWMMEILHMTTSFGDLYNNVPSIGSFDVMSCACGTHPSSHTKSAIGWFSSNAIKGHALGKKGTYSLHPVSLPQPAPPWRATAVRVASRTTTGHFMVEARLRTDQYEANSEISSGIPGEGVIVYEVQGTTEVFLRTPVPLQVGETFADMSEKLKIKVVEEETGGFRISIDTGSVSRCVQLGKQIEALATSIELEEDLFVKKQLISALQKAKAEFRQLGCLLVHDPATHVFSDMFFGAPTPEPSQDDDRKPKASQDADRKPKASK